MLIVRIRGRIEHVMILGSHEIGPARTAMSGGFENRFQAISERAIFFHNMSLRRRWAIRHNEF